MWNTERSSRRSVCRYLVAVLLWTSQPLAAQEPEPLTLSAALDAARENNPLVRAAAFRIQEADGNLTQAAILLVSNPEVSAFRGRRSNGSGAGGFSREFELGIEQQIEIAGQRGKRIGVARAEMEAVQGERSNTERTVALAVATTFYEVLASQERLELAERGVQLSQELLDLAQRRLDAGIGTPLEVNAAIVRLAESRRAAFAEVRKNGEARILMRRLLGLPPGGPLALDGTLPSEVVVVRAEEMVARALNQRPDLGSAGHRIDAASASADLAGAQAWPDIAVDASFAREEGQDLLMAGVSIPLSLFNRNQGGRASARAALQTEVALRDDLALAIEAEARGSILAYQQAGAAINLYDGEVLRAQQESLGLVQVAAEAGELSIADVLVVQRELLDGLAGYLDARLELATARAHLRAAAALPQTTDLNGEIR